MRSTIGLRGIAQYGVRPKRCAGPCASCPFRAKLLSTTLIATLVYWPLARAALVADKVGFDPEGLPLAPYRHRSFYSMRTDALDRFGTRLEHRFRREEILAMMERVGLRETVFSDYAPYWCAVGRRSTS
jgi:hypothetical protein